MFGKHFVENNGLVKFETSSSKNLYIKFFEIDTDFLLENYSTENAYLINSENTTEDNNFKLSFVDDHLEIICNNNLLNKYKAYAVLNSKGDVLYYSNNILSNKNIYLNLSYTYN